jgi:CHAD domain-containing protein
MVTGTTLAASPTEHRGLAFWMERVLKELEKVKSAPTADPVHDLRVAIRRCRSVAAVLEEVDPDAAWKEMRKYPRKLFRALGELRDTQVLEEWTAKLAAEGDAIRERLLAEFSTKEKELCDEVARVAGKFDPKTWRKFERTLRRRARLVPPDRLAAECLAVERLEAAKELHAQALRTANPEAWHRLRIGVKKFRYTVESLLPTRYETWGEDLKRVQDLLGEVHDLSVLAQKIDQLAAAEVQGSKVAWKERLASETQNRLETYRQWTLGKSNLWQGWSAGLPQGSQLETAAMARLHVTVRAVDENARRSGQISMLAMRLYDGLVRAHVAPVFANAKMRIVMRAAARLHGIGSGLDSKKPEKAARDLLYAMQAPAGWSAEDWELVATIVRYHRGVQPQQKHKEFAKLGEEQQRKVCVCAGVLRLARVLRKCGVERTAGVKVEKSVDALMVRVPGWIDTEETAAEIAAGKHLLETCIGCPLILKAGPALSNLVELRKKLEQVATAVASD